MTKNRGRCHKCPEGRQNQRGRQGAEPVLQTAAARSPATRSLRIRARIARGAERRRLFSTSTPLPCPTSSSTSTAALASSPSGFSNPPADTRANAPRPGRTAFALRGAGRGGGVAGVKGLAQVAWVACGVQGDRRPVDVEPVDAGPGRSARPARGLPDAVSHGQQRPVTAPSRTPLTHRDRWPGAGRGRRRGGHRRRASGGSRRGPVLGRARHRGPAPRLLTARARRAPAPATILGAPGPAMRTSEQHRSGPPGANQGPTERPEPQNRWPPPTSSHREPTLRTPSRPVPLPVFLR